MKLLVLGGSRFVGRHIVQAALQAGDEVTVFNRGQSATGLFAGVQQLIGDRRSDLGALSTGEWDAVIDTCGYLPAEVRASTAALAGRVQRYVFISTISVYASFAAPNREDSPLGQTDTPDTATVDPTTYGPLKALCEQAVVQAFGGAALIIRPGLVVGPNDPTQRFTYWPARVQAASDFDAILAPGAPDDPIQCIDVRDLAAFTLHALRSGASGPFNAASAPGQFSIGELLASCAAATSRQPRFVWADAGTLDEYGIAPWTDMPVWTPPSGDTAGLPLTDTARARHAGLTIRPLLQTVLDTLQWLNSLPPAERVITKAGLRPEREAAVLAAAGIE
ncbi:MAG TPA: NAD-dependent epimerase/dehydratase family protein [Burkholderiaceae bacterium]|nr:NAD-dependent epimerase/dehydratase family protein [Burkholderiaceae bacterium]